MILLLLLLSQLVVEAQRTDLPPECVHSSQQITELNDQLDSDYRLGTAIASLGDIDGDGVNDVAFGAPGDSHGKTVKNAGAVYIVLRNADGSVKKSTRWIREDASKNDFFGSSLARISDIDGNGVDDLVVGVPGIDRNGFVDSGGFATLFLNSDGTVERMVESTRSLRPLRMLNVQDEFGGAIANLGDLNGDGYDDLAIGAKNYDEGGIQDTGCVYICHLNQYGHPDICERITGVTVDSFPRLKSRDYFGESIAVLGSMNSDDTTVKMIAVGSPGFEDTGAAYILFLKKQDDGGYFASNYSRISDDLGIEFFALGDRIGASMASSISTTGNTRLAIGDDKSANEFGAVVIFEIIEASLPEVQAEISVERYPQVGLNWLKEVATVSSGIGGGPTVKKLNHFASSIAFLDKKELLVGVMYDDAAGYASGSVWQLSFGSFKHSICLPQTLLGGSITDPFNSKSKDSTDTHVILPLVIFGIIILILGITACCYVLLARKRRRDLDCEYIDPCPKNKSDIISGSTQHSMFHSQIDDQYDDDEALIGVQLPEDDGETSNENQSAIIHRRPIDSDPSNEVSFV